MEQSSILLKNPAAELYEILNRAACQEKEMQVESVLKVAVNLNEDSSESDILINGWAKLYHLLTECKQCLKDKRFDEAERDANEIMLDDFLISVDTWQRICYQSRNGSSTRWESVPNLSKEKWLNLKSLRVYANSLDKKGFTISDDQLEGVINIIRIAIDKLRELDDKNVDTQMKAQIIQDLESIIKDIQSDKFTTAEEIKSKISVVTCDLINTLRFGGAFMVNTYLIATICLNLCDQVDIALHAPENFNSVKAIAGQVVENINQEFTLMKAILENSSQDSLNSDQPKQLKPASEK
jgi:hypothetical protein